MNDVRSQKLSKVLFWLTIIGISTYMVVLSAIAPVMSDDLLYSRGLDQQGLEDLSDVVRSVFELSQKASPRLGTALFVLISFFGRWLFIVLNPVVFLALGYVTFVLALGHRADPASIKDVVLLLFIYLVIGGAGPAITEVSFWANGALLYLWGCAAVFGFLVPFRLLLDGKTAIRDTPENAILMFVVGWLIGLTSETIVPTAILLLLLLWVTCRLRGEPLPMWFFAGLAGIVAGLLLFLTLPGSYRRASHVSEASWNMTILERLVSVTPFLFNKFVVYGGRLMFKILEFTAIAGVMTLLVDSVRTRTNRFAVLKNRQFMIGLIFLAASAVAIFSLFVAPAKMSSRVYFPAGMMIVVFLVAFVRLLFFENYPTLAKYVVGLTCFLCFMEMAAITKAYIKIHPQYRQRLELVEKAQERGDRTIVLPRFRRQRHEHIWLRDISTDPDYAENRVFAGHYGFDKVIGIEPEDTGNSQR